MARGKSSAGILLYRLKSDGIEVLLVHPGGPFWAKKDDGAWTIPKGELAPDEDPLAGARRELLEETGLILDGEAIDLGVVRQTAGKQVHAFALEGDCDPATLASNTFEIEWPPQSGKRQEFPEVDRAQWFSPTIARRKINPAQASLIVSLQYRLGLMDRP